MEKQNTKTAQVFHFDLQGRREDKYNFLINNSLDSISWTELKPEAPNYFLVKKDFDESGIYEKGFRIDELFPINSSGIKTHRDHFVIDFDKEILLKRIGEFYNVNQSDSEIERKFNLKNNVDFLISTARKIEPFNPDKLTFIEYRPFDRRYCYYEGSLIDRARENVMQHFLKGDNLGLSLLRQSRAGGLGNYWITKSIVGKDAISSLDTCTIFPLYLYQEEASQQSHFHFSDRIPNLNIEIVEKIAQSLNLVFVEDERLVVDLAAGFSGTLYPMDLMAYIYAVLHSPTYREKYKEFLKIDFPRIPYPKSLKSFKGLGELGYELINLHLLESPTVTKFITQYPNDGDNVVIKPRFQNSPLEGCPQDGVVGRVYINDTQYFDNVPEIVWNFYIGGYQPAQKWLKDRKDRRLEFEDILHYQKIIVALSETDRLMKEIDKLEIN